MEDTENTLQYYTALTHEVDIFISTYKQLRNTANPQQPVLIPGEFIKEVRNQGKN
jgi:hypothetical protein